jgi:restriction system protein
LAVPWFEIIAQLEHDPEFLFKIPWRKLEEIIAGAYVRAGWPDVVLTPRSGDRGRDVIATRPGICSIRIVDQVKAYKPGLLVKADEVRSLLGVLAVESRRA